MPIGPGKYDAEVTKLMKDTGARVAMVIVIGGNRGEGFSVAIDLQRFKALDLVGILRHVADQIEQDCKGD